MTPDRQLFNAARYTGATGSASGYMAPYTKYTNTNDIRGSGIEGTDLKAFHCPSDPSYDSMNARWGWGPSPYASNFQLFGNAGAGNTAPVASAQNGNAAWEGKARIPASIADGTSNSRMLIDKMAQCNPANGTSALNMWTRWDYLDMQTTFAGYTVGAASKFQATTAWQTSACNATIPSSPHTGIANAVLADASVRSISASISGNTWWAACTPSGGDTLGSDW